MVHEDALAWRKSSFSGGGDVGGANCVELAPLSEGFAVRDSKNPGAGALTFSRTGVARLIDDLRALDCRCR